MAQSAGRARGSLWVEIGLALLVKTIALVLIYLLFFATPPTVPPIGRHLFGAAVHGGAP